MKFIVVGDSLINLANVQYIRPVFSQNRIDVYYVERTHNICFESEEEYLEAVDKLERELGVLTNE